MTGLFDSLKSAIFVEEGETTTEKVLPTHTRPVTTTANTATTFTADTTVVSGKIKQRLMDELAKNLSGSPYSQYQKMNNSMKTKISDISTRGAALGVALEGQGVTKQVILDGTKGAIAFLNAEAANFQGSVTDTINNLEQQLKAKNESIIATIDTKQKLISQLNEDITNLQKEKTEFEIKVSQEKGKLETSKVEFNASFNELTQEINKDINDITTYLGV